ncbi:hypothetical protein [Psychrobacter sp. CAL346-MNA-CIBAN-0220]|uniref:hypothetical protein n=1 Tax=Psychrobacter sp. CAL346-MNA-CIBAN-0220 TaxID=3140457 RepID=UPI0033260A2D
MMVTIIIWVVIAGLLLVNIALRLRVRHLKARLGKLSNPQEKLVYLREHVPHDNKITAIKALREQYPELSLSEANQLWQQK